MDATRLPLLSLTALILPGCLCVSTCGDDVGEQINYMNEAAATAPTAAAVDIAPRPGGNEATAASSSRAAMIRALERYGVHLVDDVDEGGRRGTRAAPLFPGQRFLPQTPQPREPEAIFLRAEQAPQKGELEGQMLACRLELSVLRNWDTLGAPEPFAALRTESQGWREIYFSTRYDGDLRHALTAYFTMPAVTLRRGDRLVLEAGDLDEGMVRRRGARSERDWAKGSWDGSWPLVLTGEDVALTCGGVRAEDRDARLSAVQARADAEIEAVASLQIADLHSDEGRAQLEGAMRRGMFAVEDVAAHLGWGDPRVALRVERVLRVLESHGLNPASPSAQAKR